jgi:hypothetical protein
MEDEKEERRGFRVTDRRRFSDTGETRSDAPSEEPADRAPEPPPLGEPLPRAAGEPVEPVNFSTFVLGLSTQALLHLGDIPNPVTHAVEQDLDAAKHVIDILGILKEKTRNNLEPAEDSLLRYVDLVRRV